MLSSFTDLNKYIKNNEISFIDFRFTDIMGRFFRITKHYSQINESMIEHGILFDGSSIDNWCDINNSDLILKPDLSTGFVDPFSSHKTLALICDALNSTGNDFYIFDPRGTAQRAINHLMQSKIANKAFFGTELEFFIFDNATFSCEDTKMQINLDSEEFMINSSRKYKDHSNHGHRVMHKKSYCVDSPIDLTNDIRSEILDHLFTINVSPATHHHEVANGQSEITLKFDNLITNCDNIQKAKYVVRNTAYNYGKSATFIPKPIKSDNGSGMHLHHSLWKNDNNIFNGSEYSNISKNCLYYIGGIQKHIKALNAITNPSTISYKRLIPGYEAPIVAAYSCGNRSVAIRIPSIINNNTNESRIELRFVDAMTNPYLCSAAVLMAGIDGIKNKIHPGEAIEENMDDINNIKSYLKENNLNMVAFSFEEAIDNLEKDYKFLLEGNVFTEIQIKKYINQKRSLANDIKLWPHPKEFLNYYNL